MLLYMQSSVIDFDHAQLFVKGTSKIQYIDSIFMAVFQLAVDKVNHTEKWTRQRNPRQLKN